MNPGALVALSTDETPTKLCACIYQLPSLQARLRLTEEPVACGVSPLTQTPREVSSVEQSGRRVPPLSQTSVVFSPPRPGNTLSYAFKNTQIMYFSTPIYMSRDDTCLLDKRFCGEKPVLVLSWHACIISYFGFPHRAFFGEIF